MCSSIIIVILWLRGESLNVYLLKHIKSNYYRKYINIKITYRPYDQVIRMFIRLKACI